jgi:hypothetical protein
VRVFLAPPGTKPKPLKPIDVQLEGHREHTDLARRVILAAVASHVGVLPRYVLLSHMHGGGWIAYVQK